MLPGLTPAHTRKSFHHSSNPASGGSRLYVEKLAPTPESFIVSPETGLWLLPAGVAEVDVVHDSKRIEWITEQRQNRRLELAARVLGRSSVDQMGCVVGGLRGNQTPAQLILELAELEMGTLTLNTGEDIPHISLCGNPDCYNARHSQLEFGSAKYAKRTVELNPHWYIPTDSGEIETIWGDILPPVDVSYRFAISLIFKGRISRSCQLIDRRLRQHLCHKFYFIRSQVAGRVSITKPIPAVSPTSKTVMV